MNRNSNRRIQPIAEADGLSPKKHRNKYKLNLLDLTKINVITCSNMTIFAT